MGIYRPMFPIVHEKLTCTDGRLHICTEEEGLRAFGSQMPTDSDRRRILDVNSPRAPEGSALHGGIAEVVGQDITALARKLVPRVNPHIVYLNQSTRD
jgi:hypothetical protein